jgi:hypothetical protein
MIRLIDLLREDIIEKTSSVPIIQEALPIIEKLGSKTLLTRTFKGIRTGAAKVTTTPPKRQSTDPRIVNVFDTVMKRFDFKTLIYCSHGARRFFIGDQYIMIPGEGFKLIWSPEIFDLLADASTMNKQGKINEFPYDSYTTKWPTGDVSEVLVDCNEYYLISTRIPIVQDYMRKNKLPEPKTYSELFDILTQAIAPYVGRI